MPWDMIGRGKRLIAPSIVRVYIEARRRLQGVGVVSVAKISVSSFLASFGALNSYELFLSFT
jgi:hypothetical protein